MMIHVLRVFNSPTFVPARRGTHAFTAVVLCGIALVGVCAPSACISPPMGGERRNLTASAGHAVVDATCVTDGCIRQLLTVGDYDKATLSALLLPGVTIDNGYTVYTLTYVTDAGTATATATVPYGVDVPPGGWSVVANAHGTIGLDDACQLSGTVSGAGLAGLFGARGSIGIAPDYPGLGTPGLHAYLSTQQEGRSVLDALRAADNLASSIGVDTSGKHAVVGLSQGGHAVFAAAALQQDYAPELDIRAFGMAAPASVYEEQWRPGLNFAGAHVVYDALLVWDWAALAGAPQDMWTDAVSANVDALMRTRCMWSPTFTDEATLPSSVSQDPTQVFTPAFITAFTTGAWGRWDFMRSQFDTNRVRAFTASAPMRIYQGSADTTVLPADTHALVDDLNSAGMAIEIVDVAGGTHIDTAFGFVAAPERATADSIAWVREQLDR